CTSVMRCIYQFSNFVRSERSPAAKKLVVVLLRYVNKNNPIFTCRTIQMDEPIQSPLGQQLSDQCFAHEPRKRQRSQVNNNALSDSVPTRRSFSDHSGSFLIKGALFGCVARPHK